MGIGLIYLRPTPDMPQAVLASLHYQLVEFLFGLAAVVASSGTYLTALRPPLSSTLMQATKFPFRFQRPRIGCLRLSRTLVYLYRRELELTPTLLWVAERFMWQHCRKCQVHAE
jgi:hypothetical protein